MGRDATEAVICVVDAEGRPVPGAFLSVQSSAEVLPEMALVTGADGCARLWLRPGELQVRADQGGRMAETHAAHPQTTARGGDRITLHLKEDA